MNESTEYQLSLPHVDFSGPLELLLRLIEERKLPIHDIALAEVTDSYISYLENLPQRDYGRITQFLEIASTLLLIKAKSLLPNIEFTEEETQSIDDLKLRLELYRLYQTRVPFLRESMTGPKMFARPFRLTRTIVFSPDPTTMTLSRINEAIHEVIREIPVKEELPEARVRITMHIEDMMNTIIERVNSLSKISFRETVASSLGAAGGADNMRVATVVGFLALLEMVRNGIVNVIQSNRFDDIEISRV